MPRYHVVSIALLVLVVSLSGCVPIVLPNRLAGSGRAATRDYPITGFTGVAADNAFKVNMTAGDNPKVSVTIDDNLLDYVVVEKRGDTLYIGLDPRRGMSYTSRIEEANVTMPQLTAVRLNGASQGKMSGFGQVSQFQASVDGASRLSGDVQATSIALQANGASQYSLGGNGQTLSLTANGASRADLSGLAISEANVKLNGASQATVNAKSTLSYNLDGASHLRYNGSPAIAEARTNGASQASQQ
jgi:hypothetical protein